MNCAWNDFLSIIPPYLRQIMDNQYQENLEELHLRLYQPVEIISGGCSMLLETRTTREDIQFVVNTASRYSPWSAATIAHGYITAKGGHRIGISGGCVIQERNITGIRYVTSLCIRIAREFLDVAKGAPMEGSLLVLGPPGVGKTTLLRDIIRMRSCKGQTVAVVDERGELFPEANTFHKGPRTDIISGCRKCQGVEIALRTMSPRCIAVDEITAAEDCNALINAGWCGVDLLATAHAANVQDLLRRPVYKPLAESGLFQHIIVLKRDKTWQLERKEICT